MWQQCTSGAAACSVKLLHHTPHTHHPRVQPNPAATAVRDAVQRRWQRVHRSEERWEALQEEVEGEAQVSRADRREARAGLRPVLRWILLELMAAMAPVLLVDVLCPERCLFLPQWRCWERTLLRKIPGSNPGCTPLLPLRR